MALKAWTLAPPLYQPLLTISDTESDSPGPRCGHSLTPVVVQNSRLLFLFGGSTVTESGASAVPGAMLNGFTNSVHCFNVSTRKWTRLNPRGLTPSPRAGHAAAPIGGFVAIQGGIGPLGPCNGDMYLLDTDSDNLMWYRVVGDQGINPGPRYGHVMDIASHRLILFGGGIGNVLYSDTWAMDTTQRPFAWERLNPLGNLPSARIYASASARNDGLFLICGGRDSTGMSLGDTFGLRLDSFGQWVWSPFPRIASSPRYQHTSVFVGPRYHVIGGILTMNRLVDGEAAVTVLNIVTGQWLGRNGPGTSMSSNYIQYQNQIMRRCRHAVASIGNNIYVHGGLRDGQLLKDFLVAEDSTCQASSSSQPPVPSFLKRSSSESSLESSAPEADQRRTVPIPRESFGNWGGLVRQRSLGHTDNENKRQNRMNYTHIPQVFDAFNNILTSTEDLRNKVFSTILKPKEWKAPTNRDFFLDFTEIVVLCNAAEQIFKREPTVLKLKAPIKVFGDLHGQFGDLMRLFREYGCPSIEGDITHIDYLFLGDYVDRGQHSLEIIILLLALKIEYPGNIHLIRGNHEAEEMNKTYGFYAECIERMGRYFGEETYNRINRLFNFLPLAALIEKKIFCMHGGIGNSVLTVEQVTNIQRPILMEFATEVIRDLLWADPTENDSVSGIVQSPRGTNLVTFGPDIVNEFCERNKIELILRGHECVLDGFERSAGGKLITVFSATNYCGSVPNAGAILVIGRDFLVVPKLIHPHPPPLDPSDDSSPENAWMMDLNNDLPPTPGRRWSKAEEDRAFAVVDEEMEEFSFPSCTT